jgi:hypothetical protein
MEISIDGMKNYLNLIIHLYLINKMMKFNSSQLQINKNLLWLLRMQKFCFFNISNYIYPLDSNPVLYVFVI